MAGMFPLFDTEGFPARWDCGTAWKDDPALGWLHVGSDVLIWFSYMSIPAVIAYFVIRRGEVAFPRIFWLFAAFIFACGAGHLIEAVIFWWPVYRLSAAVKFATAVVSLVTVVSLLRVVPEALESSKLDDSQQNRARDVADRRQAEERLSMLNDQLNNTLRDVEQFNRVAANREQRMADLKREVNALARELGRHEPYELSTTNGHASAN